MVEGVGAGEFLRVAVVTAIATAVMLVLAGRRRERREL